MKLERRLELEVRMGWTKMVRAAHVKSSLVGGPRSCIISYYPQRI